MSRVGSSKIRITEILGRIDLNDTIPRMSSPSSISSRATATRAVSAHRLLLVAAVPPSGRYGKLGQQAPRRLHGTEDLPGVPDLLRNELGGCVAGHQQIPGGRDEPFLGKGMGRTGNVQSDLVVPAARQSRRVVLRSRLGV
jgi:hypothetical protein